MLAEIKKPTKKMKSGLPDKFVAMAHPKYLYHKFEMDAEGLQNRVLRMLEVKH